MQMGKDIKDLILKVTSKSIMGDHDPQTNHNKQQTAVYNLCHNPLKSFIWLSSRYQ